jgi:hypothetical protein
MIGRVIKRVSHRLVRTLVVSPVLRVVAILVVFGLIGLGAYQIIAGASFSLPTPGLTASIANGSNAPETFLKGNQTYDASLVWDSLNDASRKRFESGGGVQAIQLQLNAAKEKGIKLEQFNFIGRKDLPDGTSMQFYVVASRTPQTGSQVEYIPYVFTVDQSGKIAKVQ